MFFQPLSIKENLLICDAGNGSKSATLIFCESIKTSALSTPCVFAFLINFFAALGVIIEEQPKEKTDFEVMDENWEIVNMNVV